MATWTAHGQYSTCSLFILRYNREVMKYIALDLFMFTQAVDRMLWK